MSFRSRISEGLPPAVISYYILGKTWGASVTFTAFKFRNSFHVSFPTTIQNRIVQKKDKGGFAWFHLNFTSCSVLLLCVTTELRIFFSGIHLCRFLGCMISLHLFLADFIFSSFSSPELVSLFDHSLWKLHFHLSPFLGLSAPDLFIWCG